MQEYFPLGKATNDLGSKPGISRNFELSISLVEEGNHSSSSLRVIAKLAQQGGVAVEVARSWRGDYSLKAVDSLPPQKTPLGPQNLVDLAKEILSNTAVKMSGTEDSAALESPTSRFTAVNVNGKEQTPNTIQGSSANGNARRGSDERSNGQPRISPPGQEKLTITTTSTQEWTAPPNGDRQPYQPPTAFSDTDSSHKRKRSGSIEQNSSSANSYHSHALPSSTKETPTTATTESDGPREESIQRQSQPEMRDSYPQEVQYRPYLASADDRANAPGDLWHSRQYAQSHINSDEQLGEVLQRSMDQQRDYDHTSPNDRSAGPYSAYPNDQRELSAQSDPKKRKRNFSNRTKTGCMTCRRRKKKCDETRPECK